MKNEISSVNWLIVLKPSSIARMIPLDIVPIRVGAHGQFLINEIEQGETIYERGN
jgi:hypothetical protein